MKGFGRAGLVPVLCGGLLMVVAAAFPLYAQESGAGTYRLGEVVVSAPQSGVEAVGTVHTVTAAEIQERGARTLDEALSLVPGLFVRTGGAGTPRIDIRGFRPGTYYCSSMASRSTRPTTASSIRAPSASRTSRRSR